jgi:hypothetical protein
MIIPCRRLLTSSLTLYVNPNGSDTNDGLTPQTAFQTIQSAIVAFSSLYDTGSYNHTIKLADGYYYGAALTEVTGGGSISIEGSGNTYVQGNIQVNQRRTRYQISNLIIIPDGTFGVSVSNGYLSIGGNISFSIRRATTPAVLVAEKGGFLEVSSPFSLSFDSGVAISLALAKSGGYISLGRPLSLSNPGAWTVAGLWAQSTGCIDAKGFTFTSTDSILGLRWLQESNGCIISDGATSIPGNVNGANALLTETLPPVTPEARPKVGLKVIVTSASYSLA